MERWPLQIFVVLLGFLLQAYIVYSMGLSDGGRVSRRVSLTHFTEFSLRILLPPPPCKLLSLPWAIDAGYSAVHIWGPTLAMEGVPPREPVPMAERLSGAGMWCRRLLGVHLCFIQSFQSMDAHRVASRRYPRSQADRHKGCHVANKSVPK